MSSDTRSRGFGSMESIKQKEIARKGGKAAHERGTAHEFTSEEARAAGRKGGKRVSEDRRHMAEIGRLGGRRSAGRRASTSVPPDVSQKPDIEHPQAMGGQSMPSSGEEAVGS